MNISSAGIKKFEGTQFEVWSTLIEAVMTARGIKYVLDGTKPEQDSTAKWDKDHQTAKALILLSLDESMVRLVLSCSTAKEVWSRLSEVHSQKSESCRMMLLQEFYNIKMQPGSKVCDYVSQTELIVKKLRDIGVRIDDETLIGKVVSGLSLDYKHFMTNWMGTPAVDRTYSNLLPRLITEESLITKDDPTVATAMKASYGGGQGKGQAKRGRKSLKDMECHYCKIKGHFKKNCRKFKKDREVSKVEDQQENTTDGGLKKYGCIAKTACLERPVFFCDSGASFHMSGELKYFNNYVPHKEKIVIQVGNNECVYSHGKGSIDVISDVDGEKIPVTLYDVEYVPGISDNLFSLGAADKRGHVIVVNKGRLRIIADGKTIVQGRLGANNMYMLDFTVKFKANIAKAERSLEEWHRAAGHPGVDVIKNMASKDCASQFKFIQRDTVHQQCGDCQAGKSHRSSHPASGRERSTEVLHRVHADLVGPIDPPTLTGSRYFFAHER